MVKLRKIKRQNNFSFAVKTIKPIPFMLQKNAKLIFVYYYFLSTKYHSESA